MDYYLMGQRIRGERQKLRMTQAQLAEKINVSTNYIGQIERGDRKPSLETLVDICNELGTTINYLLADNLTTPCDNIIVEVVNTMNGLSRKENLFFYNIILNYVNTLH